MKGLRSPFFPDDRAGTGFTQARVTRLYFDITEELGDPRGYKMISVQNNDTFTDLKTKYATKYCLSSLGSRGMQDGSLNFFKLKLMFRSISRLSRMQMTPHETDIVLRVLEDEEKHWPGFIYLVLVDIRKSRLPSASNRSRSTPDMPAGSLVPISHLRLTTEWLLPFENISGVSILEQLNGNVGATATKCGYLQKFQSCKDLWRDEYVVIDEARLWFYELQERGIVSYSYVDLNASASVFISEDNSSVINIVNQPRVIQSKSRVRRLSTTGTSKDALQIRLKARSKEEALEWLKAIQIRRENTYDEDNLKIMLAEKQMESVQEEIFHDDLEKLNGLINFEGMLENRYLRQHFQQYLKKSSSDEFLKFWEYAEDYRRGHPQSPQQFSFGGNDGISKRADPNEKYISSWAKQIFEEFLKDGARQQISDCSSEDRTKIMQGIEVDVPAYNLFAVVQALSFQSLKFTWYPQFTRLNVYPSLLKSALKVVECPKRDDLLTKFIGVSYGCLLSAKSIQESASLDQHSTDQANATTTPISTSQGGFFGFFRKSSKLEAPIDQTSRGSSLVKSSTTGKDKVDTEVFAASALDTPWRRSTFGSNSFDSWISSRWWELMVQGSGGLQDWRQSYSNPEFENSLIKMMPSWMPVKRESIDHVLADVAKYIAKKSIDSMHESINAITHLRSLAESRISQENAEALLLKYRETFLGTELSERLRSGDVEKCKSALLAMPTIPFARSSLYINHLTCNMTWGGIVVYYCCMICNSFSGRNIPGKGEGNARYSQDLSTPRTSSPVRSSSAGQDKRLARMYNMISSSHESAIQSPLFCETRAMQHSDTFTPAGGRRLCVLMETIFGEGFLCLFDMSANNPFWDSSSIVQPASCIINLSFITELCPAQSLFSSIDLYDSSGLIWQLHPEGVDDDDANISTTRLLNYLSEYVPPTAKVTKIMKNGFLLKRGKLNPSYKSRWFVLSSDQKLQYYKFENGQSQGIIDISHVSEVRTESSLVFTMIEGDRLWTLQAPNEIEKSSWVEILSTMIKND